MTQQDLFIPMEAPIARNSDPAPSKLAAKQITESGQRQGQLNGVLSLLRKHPLSTSLELSKYGYDRYIVARRLPELERARLVIRRASRTCSIGQRPATTWEAL